MHLTNRSQPFNVPLSAFAAAAPRSRLHSLTRMDWRQLKVAEAELEQKQLALEALKVQQCTKCESLAEQLAAQSTQLFAAVSSANTLTHELWQKVLALGSTSRAPISTFCTRVVLSTLFQRYQGVLRDVSLRHKSSPHRHLRDVIRVLHWAPHSAHVKSCSASVAC